MLGSQVEDEASRRNLPGGPGAQVRVLSPDGRLAALAEGNKIHVFDTSMGQETLQIDSADDPFPPSHLLTRTATGWSSSMTRFGG